MLNTVESVFATASGSKGLTVLTVMALVERGMLGLSTLARSLLADDLPLIADDATIEQLLAHRSGIGDYLDEDTVADISDYLMPMSVHELATTEQFLPVLDGHETVFPAGERFQYNNGRLRRARLARRTGNRHELLTVGSHAGLRACRHARHRVPTLR